MHDKLVVSASELGYRASDSRTKNRKYQYQENEGWHELIQPLVDADVIYEDPIKPRVNRYRPPPSYQSPAREEKERQQDAWYETGRIISLEQNLHIPALPMIRQRQTYEKEGNVSIHHTVTNLTGKYSEMKKTLMDFRYHESISQNYGIIRIPPIAFEVVSKAPNKQSLIQQSLELRDKYTSLRDSLRQLRQDLADPSTSPINKARAIKSWNKSWETLTKYDDLASLVTVANTTTGMLDIEREKAERASSALTMDFDGIVSNILRLGVGALASWRVRVLHNTARQFLNTSNQQLAISTERLFNRTLDRRDFEKVDKITQPR